MTDVLTQPRPIRLKGRSFLALSLTPELPIEDWLVRLDDLAARSAGFFLRRPIVLDVEGLEINRDEMRFLVAELNKRKVRIMGIEGAKPSSLAPDLPPAMSDGRPASDPDAEKAATETAAVAPSPRAKPVELSPLEEAAEQVVAATTPGAPTPSLVVTQPVRSGQSIVFLEGDVTIIGSVASGAEVVAGGSIHIYGALRGRALAGTTGNSEARIFCTKQEAELIAIDGYYKTAEDLEPEPRGQAVQFWLQGDTISTGILG